VVRLATATMTPRQHPGPTRRTHKTARADSTPSRLGVDPARYAQVLSYLFDRPVPEAALEEWYWHDEQVPFEASPLEWTRLQTAIFANAAVDLSGFDDEQVGMGLTYLTYNGVSDVPFAAIDPSVPLDEAMRMMQALPALWRGCIGPRLQEASPVDSPIGSVAGGRLGHACHMWFDIWPTFRLASASPHWRDACWNLFVEMLEVPCRAVQIAALHGIGHSVHLLDRDNEVDRVIGAFVRRLKDDHALRDYAEAARAGMVQ
jgi:hypothetical protein